MFLLKYNGSSGIFLRFEGYPAMLTEDKVAELGGEGTKLGFSNDIMAKKKT